MTDKPLTVVQRLPLQPPNLGREVALAAIDAAIADIGKGEELANNQGPYVWSLTGRKTRGAWCAAAIYTWFKRGASTAGAELAVPRTHGARKLARLIARHGRWVGPEHRPERGDVALWSRGATRWMGHVEIVELSNGGSFVSVGGNVGRFPALVRRFTHQIGERRLLGFARYY